MQCLISYDQYLLSLDANRYTLYASYMPLQDSLLTWVEISLRAIDHNIKELKKLFEPGVKLMAVVKSNAYGHGLFDVAVQALKSGVDYLGVATADEALELRRKGIFRPVIVLGGVAKDDIAALIRQRVTLIVYNSESLKAVAKFAEALREKATIHLKVETGINRLGFRLKELPLALRFIWQNERSLFLEGIYTHLASVEELNSSYTKSQLLEFERALFELQKMNLQVPLISTAASAAATMIPESRYNMVRLGIEVYGLWPSRGVEVWAKKTKKTRKLHLRPALAFKTRLIHKSRIPAGAYIGYGSTFQARKPMVVGVIPVGYYEGYPRILSNLGFALLKGAVVPVVGRVCMNMTILDISKRPKAKVGDEVVLIGESKGKKITAQDVADWAQTINYEIVTRIPDHIPRVYLAGKGST